MTKVLDCTLRDGGYYGDWDFDTDVVNKYLAAVATAKVDIVEIGFRFLPQDKFLGAFAYSTDEYLSKLPLPPGVLLAVMVNANELINYEQGAAAAVIKLFTVKSKSPVEIVRIATHVKDLDACEVIAKKLNALGYLVMINLMQIDSIEEDQIDSIAAKISHWECIEVLYFADSFGNMSPESAQSIIKHLRQGWSGHIGIHTHDNKGQALSNCMASIKSGVSHLDSTLLGMGRGAGNVRTENLLVELTQCGYGEYFPDALFPLVLQDFKKLQERFGWGPNIYYFLSAAHGIHPTYIQEMLGDGRYGTEHILSAINFLKSTRAPFYSLENMLRAISGMDGNEYGEWSATGWMQDRTVLILGSGPATKRYIGILKQFIERTNPIVLCLNINESVPEDIVSAFVACHEYRILIESDHYATLNKPLIIPLSRVPDGIRDALNGAEILDYGLRVQENTFQISDTGCILSSPLAVAYAISLATVGGAEKILLAGMDGYEISDPRQKEMEDMFQRYSDLDNALPICAITPTTYPVEQRSVYEPDLHMETKFHDH